MAAAAVTRGTITRNVGVDGKRRRSSRRGAATAAIWAQRRYPLRGAKASQAVGSPIARRTRISNFALVNGEEMHPPIIISPCSVAMGSQRIAFRPTC